MAALQSPDEEKRKVPRMMVKRFLVSSTAGRCITLLISSLALLTSVVYIIQTYYTSDPGAWQALNLFDFVVAVILLLQWALKLYISQHRLNYLFSLHTAYDWFITLPTVIPAFLPGAMAAGVRKVVAMARILRIAKLAQIFRLQHCVSNSVTQQIINIITFSATMILLSAAVIQLF